MSLAATCPRVPCSEGPGFCFEQSCSVVLVTAQSCLALKQAGTAGLCHCWRQGGDGCCSSLESGHFISPSPRVAKQPPLWSCASKIADANPSGLNKANQARDGGWFQPVAEASLAPLPSPACPPSSPPPATPLFHSPPPTPPANPEICYG